MRESERKEAMAREAQLAARLATLHPSTPGHYRGTALIRKSAPLGPYSRNMHRALWWS